MPILIRYWMENLIKCSNNLSENRAWTVLEGLGFVRQFFMGRRFFDFFNLELGICIEIDGYTHCSVCDKIKDDYFLQVYKIQTIRVKIRNGLKSEVRRIAQNLKALDGYDPYAVFRDSYKELYKTKEKKGKKTKKKHKKKRRLLQEKNKKKSKLLKKQKEKTMYFCHGRIIFK